MFESSGRLNQVRRFVQKESLSPRRLSIHYLRRRSTRENPSHRLRRQ